MLKALFTIAIGNLEKEEFNVYNVIYELIKIDGGKEYLKALRACISKEDPFGMLHRKIENEIAELASSLGIEKVNEKRASSDSGKENTQKVQYWRKI